MTLRLPRTLRDAITTHTQTTGDSLNSWIVEAVTGRGLGREVGDR